MNQQYYDRQVALWLSFCAAVVLGMILLGAVTRLTGSGLSMVEWKPLMGAIPPLSEHDWQETFDKYKAFPEYQKVNHGMSLHEFKSIFMFEYLHRVLGRLIGVIFFFPMLFFAFTRRIRPGLLPHLVVLFVLGGLQGLLGWYMVKSGLVNDPRVSQYRLTAHLGVAVLIYSYMLWLAFELRFRSHRQAMTTRGALSRMSGVCVLLVYLMILSGGLVAGTRAGLAYPTWPLMGDSLVPPGLYSLSPAWLSAFEDVTTIQFNHRMFAYTLFILLNVLAWRVFKSGTAPRARRAAILVAVALWLQVGLGISTLLLRVPVPLAAAHQGGGILLLSSVLWLFHVQRRQGLTAQSGYQN